MAHALTIRNDGKVEMAYAGQPGWHKLGNHKPDNAIWSIEDWIKASGMDWRAERSTIRFTDGTGADVAFPERYALYRSDNNYPLGVVSRTYREVQPRDIWNFIERLADQTGFEVETAGTLFGGRRFWALMAVGEEAAVVDARDKAKGYILATTSLDGSLATQIYFTIIRVVCNNTLSWSVQKNKSEGKSGFRMNHNTAIDWAMPFDTLGITVKEQFSDTMALLRVLAQTEMDQQQMLDATAELFRPGCHNNAELLARVLESDRVERVMELANGEGIGAGLDGAHGTSWGWLNAVTQYVDHETGAKTDEGRVASAWFGRGAQLKARAVQMCVQNFDGTVAYRDATDAEALAHVLAQ